MSRNQNNKLGGDGYKELEAKQDASQKKSSGQSHWQKETREKAKEVMKLRKERERKRCTK